jgi:hypothetical protein
MVAQGGGGGHSAQTHLIMIHTRKNVLQYVNLLHYTYLSKETKKKKMSLPLRYTTLLSSIHRAIRIIF